MCGLFSHQGKVRYASRELQLIHNNVRLIHHNAQLSVLQRIEAEADRLFRAKQTERVAEIRRFQTEGADKEEGTECFITSPAGLADI